MSNNPIPTEVELMFEIIPHRADGGLHLACQYRVMGDLRVIKHPDFWGQRVQPADHTGQGEA